MKSALKTAAAVGVTALAVARLTRFITTDTLGEWTIVGPAKLWATRAEAPGLPAEHAKIARQIEDEVERGDAATTPHPSWGWRSKLVSALDCPYCVGQWIATAGVIALAIYRTPRAPKILKTSIKFVGSILALNYVTGNVNARLD